MAWMPSCESPAMRMTLSWIFETRDPPGVAAAVVSLIENCAVDAATIIAGVKAELAGLEAQMSVYLKELGYE